MKKIALASAIALASITAAHAAPTVYGKAFLTVDYDRAEAKNGNKTNTTKLNSNSSRIGFKGDEDLTDTTKLVYQLEYGIDVDSSGNQSSGNQQFYSRNTYLGLAHNTLGTVMAGRMDTPFKTSKGSVDVFNDNSATLSIDRTGSTVGVSTGNFTNLGENRVNNVIAYKSPAIVGMPVTFNAAISLSENGTDGNVVLKAGTAEVKSQPIYANPDDAKNPNAKPVGYTKYTSATAPTYSEKKIKDNGYSASLVYDQNGLYGAVGYDSNIGVEDKAWRVAASLDTGKMLNAMPGLMLGALYQNADLYDTNDDAKTWLVSGKYKIGETPWAVKAQYINTDFGMYDTKEAAIGTEYAFNKAAKAHLYAGKITRDNQAVKSDTIVGTGIEYKF